MMCRLFMVWKMMLVMSMILLSVMIGFLYVLIMVLYVFGDILISVVLSMCINRKKKMVILVMW